MYYINLALDYLKDFATKSGSEYNIDPIIFCVLFFGSAIPLYYGYYKIGKSALKIEERKLKRKTIDKSELKKGIIISVASWWIPYVYVIFFGKLPLYLWLGFFAFLIIMGIFFIKTLLKKISNAKDKDNIDVNNI